MKFFQPILLRISLLFFIGTGALEGYAQNQNDALRHSLYTITGSARSMGMGGAYSAVGADLSSATLNPAGLAVYRSSTFALSPAYSMIGNQGEYLDTTGTGRDSYFGIPSWGFAFTTLKEYDNGRTREEVREGLKSYTFAFGHNQLENYTRNVVIEGGFNDLSSLSDMFAEQAQGIFYEQLPDKEFNAWSTFVIDNIAGSNGTRYFPAVTAGNTQQDIQLQEEGRRNEWFISLAGNFSDKIYIGGTIGIQRLQYSHNFTFIESDINNLYQFYENNENSGFPLEIPTIRFEYNDNFSTRGTGINGKFGMIYRPVDRLRIGLAVNTPTIFSLTDEFSSSMTHLFTDADSLGEFDREEFSSSEPARFQYLLTTPYRLTLGAMYLIGKHGLLTADVEMTDYSSAKLASASSDINDPNYYTFAPENQGIKDLYQNAINARFGGEFRQDIFRVRAGAAFLGNAIVARGREYLDYFDLETIRSVDGQRRILTLGAGIRQPNFYLDVSFINQTQKDLFNPYFSEKFTPSVISTRNTNTIISTIGFTF